MHVQWRVRKLDPYTVSYLSNDFYCFCPCSCFPNRCNSVWWWNHKINSFLGSNLPERNLLLLFTAQSINWLYKHSCVFVPFITSYRKDSGLCWYENFCLYPSNSIIASPLFWCYWIVHHSGTSKHTKKKVSAKIHSELTCILFWYLHSQVYHVFD